MFTTGKIIFAILFALTFIGFMIWSYKKDSKNHKTHYKKGMKGVWQLIGVIIGIFVFLRFLPVLTKLF